MINSTEIKSVDFLIIGTGIAGLSAALTCSKYGTVGIITKGGVRDSNTHWAQGGIAAAIPEHDQPDFHYQDTIQAGDELCNEKMVKILVEEGIDCVKTLIELGANFDRKGAELSYTKEGAHSQRRILHAGDSTGREIEKTLGQQLQRRPNVTFFPHRHVLKLVVADNQCNGCVTVGKDGVLQFAAKEIILATGGGCQVYAQSTNPQQATGDGIAIGYREGCQITDMEFIQFHPTTFVVGDQQPISMFLISEAVRGEGAVLRNESGKTFMSQYHPQKELASRDIVSRAIVSEIKKQTRPYVYLDLTQIELNIEDRFPTIYQRCLEYGIDMNLSPIPVAPAAHYMIGGIKVNEWGQTGIHHLYAIGEVAGTGIHGANRLASNSLLEGLVFGNRTARYILENKRESVSVKPIKTDLYRPINKTQLELAAIRQDIKSIMWTYVGIERSESGLRTAQEKIEKWKSLETIETTHAGFNEVRNMVLVAQLIITSALQRTESRGGHYRVDYPRKDNQNWGQHIIQEQSQLTRQLF